MMNYMILYLLLQNITVKLNILTFIRLRTAC